MSVYTNLTKQDIEQLLARYDIGTLISFKGIDGGVENTNYFLDVGNKRQQQRYVLTLFEYLPAETLPFFIDYTDALKSSQLPVPNPIRDRQNLALHTVKGKPALIVECFRGQHPNADNLTSSQCRQVGAMLAKIHMAGQDAALHQENQRGLLWLDNQQRRLTTLLSPDDANFLTEQWANIFTALKPLDSLPKGLIHGDLFHDNVLLEQGRISAIIDFYQACHDWLIYDLAVTANDWCLADNLELDHKRLTALIEAYTAVRPLTEGEKKAWPLMLRLAAFRFWISRLITFVYPETPPDVEHQKNQIRQFLDPNKFKHMLKLRTDNPAAPIQDWL